MNPPQLSVSQVADLAIVVKANRLSRVPIDLSKAQLFLDLAIEAMSELSNINANSVRYDTAYNIAHNVGEALLAAYGYRTTSGPGQHMVVGEFLEIVLIGGPAQAASSDFNALREGRNALHYQGKPIGKLSADFACATAQTLLNGVQIILV